MDTDAFRNGAFTEYAALRAEILALIHERSRFWTYDLTAVGTLLGVAIQFKTYSFLLMAPLIHFPLATYWSYADKHIIEIGLYIKNNIEPKVDGMAWEKTMFGYRRMWLERWPLKVLPLLPIFGTEIVGVMTFGGSTIVSLILWVFLTKYGSVDYFNNSQYNVSESNDLDLVLLISDVVVFFYSYFMVMRPKRYLLKKWNEVIK